MKINKKLLLSTTFIVLISSIFMLNLCLNDSEFASIKNKIKVHKQVKNKQNKLPNDLNVDKNIDAKSYLINYDGKTLSGRNMNENLPIASLSKLVTVDLVMKQIKKGKLSLDDQVTLSKKDADLSNNKEYSGVPMTEGEKVSIKELIDAAMISSSNSAAMELGSIVSNNNDKKMSEMMNKDIDKKNSNYLLNACGLDDKDLNKYGWQTPNTDKSNMMSANELLKFTQKFIKNNKEILNITSQKNYIINGNSYDNSNALLSDNSLKDYHINGLKTGTSNNAGECLITTGTFKNKDFIVIVLGANENQRNLQTKNIILDNLK